MNPLSRVLAAAALLAAACAELPRAPGDAFEFELTGRFAARYRDEAASGTLAWRHRAAQDEVLLSSPFGQGLARISRVGGTVTLVAICHHGHLVEVADLVYRVDGARIERHEQGEQGIARLGQQVAVGRAHRADQQLVLHGPAVDEQELLAGVGPVQRRQPGETGHRDPFPLGLDGQRIVQELAAHDAPEPRQMPVGPRRLRLQFHARPLARGQREADGRMRHGQALHHLRHGHVFRALALEEFQPRRRRREQLAHLDLRAAVERRRPQVLPGTAVDRAQGEARDQALFFDQMDRKLPAGLSRDEEPLYLDLDFLDGTKGAHVNISGVSGVATKTSYATFLVYSLFSSGVLGAEAANTKALIFNVKGEDLLFLDRRNLRLDDAAAAGEFGDSNGCVAEAAKQRVGGDASGFISSRTAPRDRPLAQSAEPPPEANIVNDALTEAVGLNCLSRLRHPTSPIEDGLPSRIAGEGWEGAPPDCSADFISRRSPRARCRSASASRP